MAAAYDTYDYPSYWEGRRYEHESEVIAIKTLLSKIPKIKTVCEIGAGYGRLAGAYIYRARKIIITDPSARLLRIARQNIKSDNTTFIQSTLENLPKKIRGGSIDLMVCIRVLHHLKDLNLAFSISSSLIKSGGYFILEFPNKRHLKATLSEFLRGNFTFPLDIFPKDIRSIKSKKEKTLPFFNYHPDVIEKMLEDQGFTLVKKLSVSNIRSHFLKQSLPLDMLLSLEKHLQASLAYVNFGPSIFVLARKTS